MKSRALAALLLVAAGPASAPSSPQQVLDGLADEIAAAAGPTSATVTARGPSPIADVLGELVGARLHGIAPATATIDLDVSERGGMLVVEATTHEHGFWGDVSRTVESTRPIDAGLRAWLGCRVAPIATTQPTHRGLLHPTEQPIDAGAPILAATAADLDGDGKAELVVATADFVGLVTNGAVKTKIPFDGPAPVPRPRAPLATIVFANGQLLARSSEHASGLVLAWQAGALAALKPIKNFPMCVAAGRVGAAMLAGALDTFPREGFFFQPDGPAPPLPPRFVAMGCAPGWSGVLDGAGALKIYRDGDKAAAATIPGVGAAFALADLDGDGQPEAIVSTNRAPGEGDQLTVYALGGQVVFKGPSWKAGIAAIAVGDFDGDGAPDIAAVVRPVGEAKGTLWIVQ